MEYVGGQGLKALYIKGLPRFDLPQDRHRLILLGDVHGHWKFAKHVCKQLLTPSHDIATFIQLGDFGWKSDYENFLKTLPNNCDLNNVKILPGNHDDYDYLENNTDIKDHILSPFGVLRFKEQVFYVSGAKSEQDDIEGKLKWQAKRKKKAYWEQEEISESHHQEIITMWESLKPQIMLSHCGPNSIGTKICDSLGIKGRLQDTQTGALFDKLLTIHEPQYWYMGHYHASRYLKEGKCTFRVLGVNEYCFHDIKAS